jgi:hypothetical protein
MALEIDQCDLTNRVCSDAVWHQDRHPEAAGCHDPQEVRPPTPATTRPVPSIRLVPTSPRLGGPVVMYDASPRDRASRVYGASS